MLSTFVQALMSAEADAICGAPYGERSPERTNSRNGYRTRDFDYRAGTMAVAVPKLRGGGAELAASSARRRAERALTTVVVATCYLLGVSTIRMEKLVETLGITRLSVRGHFPTEQAAMKCLYLVTRSLDPKGTGQTRWTMRWKPALNAFAVTFADRMPQGSGRLNVKMRYAVYTGFLTELDPDDLLGLGPGPPFGVRGLLIGAVVEPVPNVLTQVPKRCPGRSPDRRRCPHRAARGGLARVTGLPTELVGVGLPGHGQDLLASPARCLDSACPRSGGQARRASWECRRGRVAAQADSADARRLMATAAARAAGVQP